MITQTESLRSLTLEVINNYRKTAKYATQALRTGSTRSIRKVDSALTKYEGKFGETVKSTLDATQEKIIAATDKADEALGKIGSTVKNTLSNTQDAIVTATDMADSAIDKFLGDASKRVAKFPPKTGRVAGFLNNDVVKSVESFGIPSVKLARFVTSKLADGAEQLSLQVAVAKKKAAPMSKSVTKKVAKAVKKTTRKVRAAA